MSEKEKLSNEINSLTTAEVKMLRRFLKNIKSIKPSDKTVTKEAHTAYLEVRKALKGIKGSLSADIISEREERI